jgi:hypothetical protein
LQSYGALPETKDAIIEDGGVEACVAALRANTSNSGITASAAQTLIQLAESDKGAVSVAKHGGTRQVIASVLSNSGTPNFQAPMQLALNLLQRVADTTEGAELLSKQASEVA